MTVADVVVIVVAAGLITALGWYFFGPRKAGTARLEGWAQRVDVTVRGGTPALVRSRHGPARPISRVGSDLAPGQVFRAFHLPADGVDSLTPEHADTVTSCPEYKVTAVRLRPPGPQD